MAVPGAGQTNSDELDAEMRQTGDSTTIAVHGYIRIKKLSAGG